MATKIVLFAIAGFFLETVSTQSTLNQQVLGTVIYTLYGDRTPYILPQNPVLTPLGAQQLYDLGTQYRNRYVLPPTNNFVQSTTIRDISPYQYNLPDIDILSTDDQFVIASAQAFMQGLYPPLVDSSNYTFIAGLSQLSNGSNVVAPLHGYQYPRIYTASTVDLNSIYISGMENCPEYTSSVLEYYSGEDYQQLQQSSQNFYDGLGPDLLEGIFTNASIGYFDAYYIWDYLNYAATHNITAGAVLSSDELTLAKGLADEWAFALTGNLSASGLTSGDHIRAIAGRTLAYRVLQSFYTNVNTGGEYSKMTLLFGSFEPMLSFAALAQLSTVSQPQFSQIPEFGSSMVFELFSLDSPSDGSYPDTSSLYVRFMYQVGTDPSAELNAYPLFGRDQSEIVMSLDDFVSGIEDIMVMSVSDWCTTCNSYSVFCPAFVSSGPSTPTGGSSGTGSTTLPSSSEGRGGISPALAGVIGAVASLVLMGLVIAGAMLLGGIRVYRRNHKRRSDLGGFKGAEKLASDQDLTLPKGAVGATVVDTEAGPARGHERVGSWELRDQAKAEEAQMPTMPPPTFTRRRPSYEDDDLHVTPFASGVKPHDQI